MALRSTEYLGSTVHVPNICMNPYRVFPYKESGNYCHEGVFEAVKVPENNVQR